MGTLTRAIEIATRAHEGQVDKAGEPYILHPLRVMLKMRTEEERIVAVLHDLVEDCEWNLDDLRREGFSDSIIEAIDVLTKRNGEGRISAAKRAVLNPLARAVKLADNADNLNLKRIPNPTSKDYERIEEYRQVRQILENPSPS